jgi:hypothetical protein
VAIVAAALLLISSAVGFETDQEVYSSGQEIMPSVQIDTDTNDSINDSAENKRRGLKLGLLLFRRG